MADYGDAYVWCGKGSDSLKKSFEGHPRFDEISELEIKYYKWTAWFWESVDEEKYGTFDWDKFHETGIQLTNHLCELLSDTKVQVRYESPYEDPIRGMDKAAIFLDNLDK